MLAHAAHMPSRCMRQCCTLGEGRRSGHANTPTQGSCCGSAPCLDSRKQAGLPFCPASHCPHLAHHVQGDKAAHNFLSEAVVRSLPQALSATERERVLASTPLSPTLNLLSSMPLVSCSCSGWG